MGTDRRGREGKLLLDQSARACRRPQRARSRDLKLRPEPLFLESLIEISNKLAITIEQQRGTALVQSDQLLRGLAPAWMRHLWVDVCPEAVLGGLQCLPIALWPLIGEIEADDRFDRLEAVFPRHREAQRRALLLRHRLAISAGNEESELIARFCNGETLYIGPGIPSLALARRNRRIQEGLHAHIFR